MSNRDAVRVENDIGGLYTMSGPLMESERISAAVLNHGSTGWYFIVSGADPQEVLEHEEVLRERLAGEMTANAGGNPESYLAVSLLVPSINTQRKNIEAAGKFLPLAEAQAAALGFPPETADLFRKDFSASAERYSLPHNLPPYLNDIISNLWIGEVRGRYYSCVLPLHAKDEGRFRAAAADLDFVSFVNKVEDIGRELDSLTRIMLLLFLAAYMVIVGGVAFLYPRREAARICAVPGLLILVTIAVLAAASIPLGFFPAVGMILVFGLGLDYMFYVTESIGEGGKSRTPIPKDTLRRTRRLTNLAILLSFATSALSFGALVLSAFVPVHVFGLTVFSGLSAAFISAMLMSGRVSAENHRNSGAPD
jgi:predicted exporter